MKMLKKMAALLLAGVMAMALLTACGDDSTPSFAQKAEDATFASIKAATGIQVNDADLKKLAESKIDLIDTEKGTFDYKKSYSTEDSEKFLADLKSTGKGSMTMALPLMKDGKMQNGTYEVMEITADNIGSLNQGTDTMHDLLEKMASANGMSIKITKIGVAAKTVNGKTYAAIAMTYEVAAVPQQ
jgi:hypothetical protein